MRKPKVKSKTPASSAIPTPESKPKSPGNYIDAFVKKMFGQVMVFSEFLTNYDNAKASLTADATTYKYLYAASGHFNDQSKVEWNYDNFTEAKWTPTSVSIILRKQAMTKVFKINIDIVNHSVFYTEKSFPSKLLGFGALPANWKVPKVYLNEPRLPRPNFYSLGVGGTDIVLDERALEYTEHIFAMSGQLFPFTYIDAISGGKNKYMFFRLTKCFDCLDEGKSRLDAIKHQFRFVFNKNRIRGCTTLFTIPQLNSSVLFGIEGVMNYRDMELKYCVEKYGLTGLKFTKVWSDGKDQWVD